jgi:hypothetical protein
MKGYSMIPIIQFSWRSFVPAQAPNVGVGQLYDLAQHHDPQLFVFHDSVHRLSALVIPNLVTQTIESLELPRSESAAAIGLLDLLRQDQMTVHMHQPAHLVARLVAWQGVHTTIVINDDAVPVGLFIPSAVVERLPNTSMLRNSSQELQDTVRTVLATPGGLARAIAAIEREHDEFHSESLNVNAPDPYVCEDHGKPHKRSRCPCDIHPDAPCGRRGVTSG